MGWLAASAGTLMVLLILRDVFHTTRHGGLSRLVMTLAWRTAARLSYRRRRSGLAGPARHGHRRGLWALTVTTGWALVYWPHMSGSFTYAAGLVPAEHTGFVDALYVSLVNLTTLGLGDIAPTTGWLRIVAPLEALIGFALLSATVSWILGIVTGVGLRLAGIEVGDPAHGQAGQIGDAAAGVAGHGQRQSADGGRVVDHHEHYPVLGLQFREQLTEPGLVVGQCLVEDLLAGRVSAHAWCSPLPTSRPR